MRIAVQTYVLAVTDQPLGQRVRLGDEDGTQWRAIRPLRSARTSGLARHCQNNCRVDLSITETSPPQKRACGFPAHASSF